MVRVHTVAIACANGACIDKFAAATVTGKVLENFGADLVKKAAAVAQRQGETTLKLAHM